MASHSEEVDSLAGAFRKESRLGGRITSPTANLDTVGGAGEWAAGGGQLLKDQLESQNQPSTLTAENPTREATAALPDLGAAASQMQLLVDIPEGWPEWSIIRRASKRAVDLVLSIAALLVLLPFLALIALAIRIESKGPVLYRQRRCGLHNRCFDIFKFRSMVPEADRLLVDLRDENMTDGLLFKVKQDPRITRVGAFIRKYSIDELPQLLNVVRGEMSLVGPRPLPVNPEAFGPIDGKRHAVRPGLTCHWQISGRSDLSYGQMVEMDLSYIRDSSIWTDLRLIALTVPVALGGDGAY